MKNNYPEISVVMSVYNGLPFLNAAIESVLSQSFTDFEFIIIDDASTDGSRDIIEYYHKIDPRIVVIFNDVNFGGTGLGYNLAKGVEIARGKYVARMDSDDISVVDRFEIQRRYLVDNGDIDIVGSWAVDIDENDNVLQVRKYPTTHSEIIRLIWANPIIHPSVLFKRDSILKIGNYAFNTGRKDDYDLWFRAVRFGLKFSNIPIPLLKYRFFSNYYSKNGFRAAMMHVRIGLIGCWIIRASPLAFVGVLVPFFRTLLPGKMRNGFHKIMNRFDPRRRESLVKKERR